MSTTPAPANDQALAVVQPGAVARQEFGAQQLARSAETAAAAAAAQAQAIVQARYIVAMQRPRDWDNVRVLLLKECKRPGFAEVAWYRKPIGKGVEGFSIRFAEAAARCMGNLMPEAPVIYDDEDKRIIRVLLTDLESNLTWTADVIVEKTVERSKLKDGQVALSVRVNSKNEPTYLVRATEDDLQAKQASAVSKATRTLAMRLLPGDIADECKRLILDARRGAIQKDPDGERKKIADAFAELGIMPAGLKAYLGHELASCSPAEIEELRGVYAAVKSGDSTWAEAMAEKLGGAPAEEKAETAPSKPSLDALAAKMATVLFKPGKDPDCPHPDVPDARTKDGGLAPGELFECDICGASWTGVAAQTKAEKAKGQGRL